MAKNTGSGSGSGSRTGSVTGRTQAMNPVTGEFTLKTTLPFGKFCDVKQDGSKFKGVAVEPDGRRAKKR